MTSWLYYSWRMKVQELLLKLQVEQHSCLLRPNELPRKYFSRYNFARVGKRRLICQESIKSDQSVAVMEIEPKYGSDIEGKG